MFDEIIPIFDKYLAQNNLDFEATIIGGAALTILGVSSRQTQDVDCLFPVIPNDIKQASIEFSQKYGEYHLGENWLNNGPSGLIKQLPDGWKLRQKKIYSGQSITLYTLGRADLLKTKLFAYCDRTDPDLEDLLILKPSPKELQASIGWVKLCDEHPKWSDHVNAMFSELKRRLDE